MTFKGLLLGAFLAAAPLFAAHSSVNGETFKVRETIETNCSETSGPITADNSPNRTYFQTLLKKGMRAPIGDFLKLWYPKKNNTETKTYFFDCEKEAWGPLATVGHYIPEGCEPDTLYSWGPKVKLDSLNNTYQDEKAWSGLAYPGQPLNYHYGTEGPPHGSIFTVISPASCFSYGLVPIRFRIKKGTRFQDVQATMKDTVHQNETEFTFFNASVIDSWSYGTPEQYDEIVKDILRISSGKRALSYRPVGEKGPYGVGLERLYNSGVPENGDQDERTLKRNLLEMIRMILKGEGRIHYAPGSCKNREKHFSTDRPTYFNQ